MPLYTKNHMALKANQVQHTVGTTVIIVINPPKTKAQDQVDSQENSIKHLEKS